MPRSKAVPSRRFVQIDGHWKFDGMRATFVEPTDRRNPVGLCLFPTAFRTGTASAKARFAQSVENAAARIVIGYSAATGGYLSIGLGGYGVAYVIDSFTPGQGWRALATRGSLSQIVPAQTYDLQVDIVGQQISLSIDQVQVLEITVPAPLQGNQTGLFAWGPNQIEFSDFRIDGAKPRVFVVMQFGPPYDDLYEEVIERISTSLDLVAFRGDDVFNPSGSGIILQDIIRSIEESDIIIAEITPVNANVFYELGYAHALNKPTILLANRKIEKLPFDVSAYRVIFYDDTIRGKRDIEDNLQNHLENVVRGFGTMIRSSRRVNEAA